MTPWGEPHRGSLSTPTCGADHGPASSQTSISCQAFSARNARSRAMNVLAWILERVKYGLAVYVAIAVDTKQVQVEHPRVPAQRLLDELPPQGLARPVKSRIHADHDTGLRLAGGPHHRFNDRLENISVLHRILGEKQDVEAHVVVPGVPAGSRHRLVPVHWLWADVFGQIHHVFEPARRMQHPYGLLLDDPAGIRDLQDRLDLGVGMIGKPIDQRAALQRFLGLAPARAVANGWWPRSECRAAWSDARSDRPGD